MLALSFARRRNERPPGPPSAGSGARRLLWLATAAAQVFFFLQSATLTAAQGSSTALNSKESPSTTATTMTTTTAGGKPLWHRPGCYQVGHTRTISIPGCVKFNLSTNACRGFCMSFSIPAAEDIGPAGGAQAALEGLASALELPPATGNSLMSDFAPTSGPGRLLKRAGAGSLASLLEAGDSGRPSHFQELAGEKRDVISVGQCCNMMETEDVKVNLRCGFNETRRLVFKSAKTCECFFCKHV